MLYYYLFFLPPLGWIVCLLSLRTALENLYPSKVWVAVGNIFPNSLSGIISVAYNQGICPLLWVLTLVWSTPSGKGLQAPPVVFNVSADTMPLILDAHITVIHLVSRRHCPRKDCGSLPSSAEGHPQALLGPACWFWSRSHLPSVSSPGQRVFQKGFLLSSGLFWTKLPYADF